MYHNLDTSTYIKLYQFILLRFSVLLQNDKVPGYVNNIVNTNKKDFTVCL